MPRYHAKINLLSKYGSGRASQKKPLGDSSKTYSPKGFTFRDVRLMPYFHNKLLDALVILTSTSINTDTVTGIDEERYLNGCTGIYGSRLE